jgi:hypothetical protein
MGVNWQPLSSRRAQWSANLESLRSHNPLLANQIKQVEPSSAYVIAVEPQRVHLGRRLSDGQVEAMPNSVPASSAQDIVKKLYPARKCNEPLLVAGLDQGWLWDIAYRLECHTPATPGHRPPLHFLARDLERLWLIMHLHDWTQLLADERVRLFVGGDCVQQCLNAMVRDIHIPWAKLCVTVDPAVWQSNPVASADALWQRATEIANAQMQDLSRKIEQNYAGTSLKSIIRRMRGERMRVMGITSHYTTFLKYSMSDWLDAFNSMGHETYLLIEQNDSQITNPLYFAQAVAEYEPDLIVMIDHFRAELPGLPRQIPCVMWVQDNLPNIFNAKAGAAQGPRDYCLGFGRLHLRDQFGYPEQRFLPAQVGVNDLRFAPRELSQTDRDSYGCDISFVSHASAPATVLVTEQLSRADSTGRKLLIDIFEQMRAVYDAGKAITHASLIGKMIQNSLHKQRFAADAPTRRSLYDFFSQRVNNALFRHQSLVWAAELDLNLHLWGRGWESHPRLGKYAKGIACNQSQLMKIYQASKINLQLTPTGAVHQRLLDGLAAGGFFLMRFCPGDLADRIHRKLWNWCSANDIHTHADFVAHMDSQTAQWLAEYEQLMGVGLLEIAQDVVGHLKLSADADFTRSAGTIWREYDRVNFDSLQKLQDLAQTYLSDDSLRSEVAASMREVVLHHFTYRVTTNRLLNLIADDLEFKASVVGAAA